MRWEAISVKSGAIEARGVQMRYGEHSPVAILEDLHLTITPGSFVTLLGPSGCGKSPLLRIVGGILEPTAGEVSIGGRPAAVAARERLIGFVPQRPALLPWKSAHRTP